MTNEEWKQRHDELLQDASDYMLKYDYVSKKYESLLKKYEEVCKENEEWEKMYNELADSLENLKITLFNRVSAYKSSAMLKS